MSTSDITVRQTALDPRYATCLASLRVVADSSVLDLSEDDFAFLTGNRIWIATDRSRARRAVEAAVYGVLDFVGYPRFPAPVEFIAACISYYVHPVNFQTACLIMEGCEYTENLISGVEQPIDAKVLFAHVLRISSGDSMNVRQAENTFQLRTQGVI